MICSKYLIHSNRKDTFSQNRPHFHEDVEITLCIGGEGVFFLEPEVYPLHRGQLFLIVPATLHRSAANDAYRSRVLRVSPSMLEEISTSQSNFANSIRGDGKLQVTLNEEQTKQLEELYDKLEEPSSEQFGGDILRHTQLLNFLATTFSHFATKESAPLTIDMEMANIKPILQYIQDHLHESFTLDSIAAHFFISKYALCRTFKLTTGFSVIDYVIHCRILRARELLRNGCRVQETGEAVGFHNNEHFIRTFKKLTGVPPKQYAKEYLHNNQGGQKLILLEPSGSAPVTPKPSYRHENPAWSNLLCP